jgi:hypothetical protein
VLLQGQRNQRLVKRFPRTSNAPVGFVHSLLPLVSVQKCANCPERDKNARSVLAVELSLSYR